MIATMLLFWERDDNKSKIIHHLATPVPSIQSNIKTIWNALNVCVDWMQCFYCLRRHIYARDCMRVVGSSAHSI